MTGRTISNTYTTSILLNGTTDNPVTVTGTISVTKGGALTGPKGTVWTVTNEGLIASTAGFGVYLAAGGTLANTVGGQINGKNEAVAIFGTVGLVLNDGTLFGGTDGVIFDAGGMVTNEAGGTIAGTAAFSTGISIIGNSIDGMGTVVNAGTVTATGGPGVDLSFGGLVNNTSSGQVQGGQGVVIGTQAGTVVNAGLIAATGTNGNGDGIVLPVGGTISNDAGGTIIGVADGIFANGGLTTVFNAGSINGASTYLNGLYPSGAGVYLFSGQLSNSAGGIITGNYYGVFVGHVFDASGPPGGYGTVTNTGTIAVPAGGKDAAVFVAGDMQRLVVDPGAVFVGTVDGGNTAGGTAVSTVELASGAAVGTLDGFGAQFIDFAQATIDAGSQWLFSATDTIGAGVTLTNSGSLAGGVTLAGGASLYNALGGVISGGSPAAVYGLLSVDAMTIGNAGVISGTDNGFAHFGNDDVLTNTGMIMGAGHAAVELNGTGGTVSNAATGTLSGAAVGVDISQGGVVANDGVIVALGSSGIGVDLSHSGDLVNYADGTVVGAGFGAYSLAPATIVNAGSIVGQTTVGVELMGGGAVSNAAGGVISGLSGGVFLGMNPGTVVNAGSVVGTKGPGIFQSADDGSITNLASGVISAGGDGVYQRAGTVLNQGSITASHDGILLEGGGVATNGSGGVILPTFDGVAIYGGGSFTNAAGGTIDAGVNGVLIGSGVGTVINDGAVSAVNAGVLLNGGGWVANQADGAIGGATFGVVVNAGGTVVNAGRIDGLQDAVRFAAGYANLLTIDPGAGFVGSVAGGNTIGSTIVSTLELASGAGVGTLSGLGSTVFDFGAVVFDPLSEWVLSGDTSGFGGTISGFAVGDTIEVTNFTATGSLYGGGVLTLSSAGAPLTINLPGSLSITQFVVSTPGGNTDISLNPVCFLAGTRIATRDGERVVESLLVGEQVVTAAGLVREIVWIGRRRIDLRRHPRPWMAWPVRVRRDAFGAGLPRRDLLLSPNHAVYAEGALIPVRCLVNGVSIERERGVRGVDYLHVELTTHDILLAEGLPVESYLDAGDRGNFVGDAGAMALHADFSTLRWEAEGCAPLVVAGPVVEAVRARVAAGGVARGGVLEVVGGREQVREASGPSCFSAACG